MIKLQYYETLKWIKSSFPYWNCLKWGSNVAALNPIKFNAVIIANESNITPKSDINLNKFPDFPLVTLSIQSQKLKH